MKGERAMKRWIRIASAAALCVAVLVGCSSRPSYKPGTYSGVGQGYNPQDKIRISVTIAEDGSIYQVNILEEKETAEIGGKALDQLAQTVVEKNTDKVDTITGATRTTEGFREALKDALDKAAGIGGDSEESSSQSGSSQKAGS